MPEMQMGVIESRFADIIWENEPVSSSELVRLCAEAFEWKRTTTFTVLKRLCEKGIFKNEKGTVTSLISREGFYSAQSKRVVEDSFGGSLPAFIAAFTRSKPLSEEEKREILRLIEGEG